MANSVTRTRRNRRYPDFLRQRRNQTCLVMSTVFIVVLATLGFAHLITNGVRNKASYSGYVTEALYRFHCHILLIFRTQST